MAQYSVSSRLVFSSAIVLFSLSSLMCGLSDSLETFVAARVLQGVSGAMMVPVGRLAVLRTTEKKDLVRAISWRNSRFELNRVLDVAWFDRLCLVRLS